MQRVKRGESPEVSVCVCVCETWQNEAWPTCRSVPYVLWRKREGAPHPQYKSSFKKTKQS